eukprot:scaffold2627_cov318-Pavlova_lutheri.AAC.1
MEESRQEAQEEKIGIFTADTTTLGSECTLSWFEQRFVNIKKSHGSGWNCFVRQDQSNHSRLEYMIKSHKVVQWDVLASSIGTVLNLGVSPAMEGFISPLNRQTAYSSLKNGSGVAVLSDSSTKCACNGPKHQFLAMRHIPNLGNPKNKTYDGMKVMSFHAVGRNISLFFYSAAAVMVLDGLMQTGDHRGGSKGKAQKNCFMDKRGKFWALDYDISHPISLNILNFPRKPPLEKCLVEVWGMNLADVHCTIVVAAWHKLSSVNPLSLEQGLVKVMKQSWYWELLQTCPIKARSKEEALCSALGKCVPELQLHRGFPWHAIRSVGGRDGDTFFYVNRCQILSFLMRLRFQMMLEELGKEVKLC